MSSKNLRQVSDAAGRERHTSMSNKASRTERIRDARRQICGIPLGPRGDFLRDLSADSSRDVLIDAAGWLDGFAAASARFGGNPIFECQISEAAQSLRAAAATYGTWLNGYADSNTGGAK